MRASAGSRAATLRRVAWGIGGVGARGACASTRRLQWANNGKILSRSLLMTQNGILPLRQHQPQSTLNRLHQQSFVMAQTLRISNSSTASMGAFHSSARNGTASTADSSKRVLAKPSLKFRGRNTPSSKPAVHSLASPPSSLAIRPRHHPISGGAKTAQHIPLRYISTNNNAPRKVQQQASTAVQTAPGKQQQVPDVQGGRIKPTFRRLSTAPTTAPAEKLTFHLSASYSAKQKRYEPDTNTCTFNPYNRMTAMLDYSARRKNRPDTGQDAFFISKVNDSGGVAMGVADGVGGYAHYGIDSADFSHTLCENMGILAYTSPSGKLHPRTLLYNAYQKLLEDREVRGGASTVCVGTVRPDGVMMVANLGDSGYIILRQGRVLYMSVPQTHAFNTPYQLSVVPPEVLDQSRMFGGDFLCDLPKDAQVSTHNLQNGDVVIFATDGVWDNLSAQDLLRIVSQEMITGRGWTTGAPSASTSSAAPSGADDSGYESAQGGTPPPPHPASNHRGGISPTPDLPRVVSDLNGSSLQASLAKAIASRAKIASLDRRVDGPFAKEVKRLMPYEHFSGGKRDDICVVCMVAVGEEQK